MPVIVDCNENIILRQKHRNKSSRIFFAPREGVKIAISSVLRTNEIRSTQMIEQVCTTFPFLCSCLRCKRRTNAKREDDADLLGLNFAWNEVKLRVRFKLD